MSLNGSIQLANNSLKASQIGLQVVGQNIANVNTTKGVDGKPYQRQQIVFESVLNQLSPGVAGDSSTQSVRVVRVEKDPRPLRMVYNPGHPDADATGMVAMPNMNVHEEMADLIASSRAYEANLAVARNARAMAMQTLSIGKR